MHKVEKLGFSYSVKASMWTCLRNLFTISQVDNRDSLHCLFSSYNLIALSRVMVATTACSSSRLCPSVPLAPPRIMRRLSFAESLVMPKTKVRCIAPSTLEYDAAQIALHYLRRRHRCFR